MSLYDVAVWGCAALMVVAVFVVPRLISARRRLFVGALLFVAGWLGIFLGLRLQDAPLLQSQLLSYAWAGLCALALVVALLFLLTGFFDWWGPTRPQRQRWRFPPFAYCPQWVESRPKSPMSVRGGKQTIGDQLRPVHERPPSPGCIEATIHCGRPAIESAEKPQSNDAVAVQKL